MSTIDKDKAKIALNDLNNCLKLKMWCTPGCNYFYFCPDAIRIYRKNEKRECKALEWDERKKKRFARVYLMGEEGVYLEARETLFALADTLNIEDDPKEMEKYINLCIQLGKQIKVDKQKVEGKPEPLTIDISAIEPAKPSKVEQPKQTKDEIESDPDPETLLDSEYLEDIVKNIDKVRNKVTSEPDPGL